MLSYYSRRRLRHLIVIPQKLADVVDPFWMVFKTRRRLADAFWRVNEFSLILSLKKQYGMQTGRYVFLRQKQAD